MGKKGKGRRKGNNKLKGKEDTKGKIKKREAMTGLRK